MGDEAATSARRDQKSGIEQQISIPPASMMAFGGLNPTTFQHRTHYAPRIGSEEGLLDGVVAGQSGFLLCADLSQFGLSLEGLAPLDSRAAFHSRYGPMLNR